MNENNCCGSPAVKDLSQGLGENRHFYCCNCKSHKWKGSFYTRQEWEEWINGEEHESNTSLLRKEK